MDACLLWVLCVCQVEVRPLSRGVLPTVVCPCVWSNAPNYGYVERVWIKKEITASHLKCMLIINLEYYVAKILVKYDFFRSHTTVQY
jgi:hypothetical protein